MNRSASKDETTAFFIKLLDEKGMTRVAIIDDAYDPIERNSFEYGEIEDFFDAIAEDTLATTELSQLAGKVISDSGEITDEVLNILWSASQQLGPLRSHCANILFPNFLQKRFQVDMLGQVLEQELGREVVRLGTQNEFNGSLIDHEGKQVDFHNPPIRLIFVDYYLGATQDPLSVKNAVRITKLLYAQYHHTGDTPLIILMSSLPDVATHADVFREASELLGGMFYFASKSDLSSSARLLLYLGAFAKALPVGATIQEWMHGLKTALAKSCEDLLKGLRELNLEDYAYIQKLSLKEDGQPMGEYLKWLYSAYLSHLLFESNAEMKTRQEAVDNLSFDVLPIRQALPSRKLAEIYRHALFAPATDIGSSLEIDVDAPPYSLHLGDLFVKDVHHEVRMILNAECDLAFTIDGERSFEPQRSILIIYGRLQPLNQTITGADKVRTELFEYEGQAYRIAWNVKTVHSCPFGELRRFMTIDGYRRIAQLRQPFALEVQRAFASDLTRIGMPPPPPIYQEISAQLLCAGEAYLSENNNSSGKDERSIRSLFSANDQAFLLLTKLNRKPALHVVPTLKFGMALKDKVQQIADELEEEFKIIPNTDQSSRTKLGNTIAQLKDFLARFDSWFIGLEPFSLPTIEGKSKDVSLKDAPIAMFRNITCDGVYPSKHPLGLNLSDFNMLEEDSP